MKISKDKKIEFFSNMYAIRRFEESVRELFSLGLIRGSTHVYIGEEAVAAGVCGALRREDYIVSTHRGHGHCIAKGGKLAPMMAELMGKETGYCKGKGGSMHIADPEIGILGAVGIVGSGLPLAVGAALSSKNLKEDKVAVSFFGDGASNQGTFHECLNLASVWKLPIVFVCENNLYAITVSCKRSTSVEDIADRAAGYGIPGVVIDGNNVEEVYRATSMAVEGARKGGGPTLIEAKTYRQEGHWIGDPQVYRNKKEVAYWKKLDPIEIYEVLLINEKVVTKEKLLGIKKDVDKELKEAVDFARESKFLSTDKVTDDIFS
ncbi:MAG: thiamine pyrophosphate-dependent dehydrogenase E1 component subunit alpha [Candidatus Humimicrobiaceae bacterium]